MKQFTFSTGNYRKVQEATAACKPFDIEVLQVKLDIDEIQSHDPLTISKHKADIAFSLTSRPVVINDAFWEIPALNGFPGGYMKDVNEWFTAQDYLDLMQRKTDRRVGVTECVIYKDEATTKIITRTFWGEIAKELRGTGDAIEQVAVFNGLTLGEHHEQGKFAYEPKEYVWHDFARWFAEYK